MCKPDKLTKGPQTSTIKCTKQTEPSFIARYTCVGILVSIMAIWGKFTFVPESQIPGVDVPLHTYRAPLALTTFYLVSLPLLRFLTERCLSGVDAKVLLKESMIVYNVAQVALNGWMVYRFIDCVLNRGHPFIGDLHTVHSGATYAVWVHYCDKYLEFFDTYFMVLRGKMNQVSFLHVYHHVTIAWAWWIAMLLFPGGDSYFGALFNSWIHVMMYSYYALSLLKISCPWKRFLTMAQLGQFFSVIVYTAFCLVKWPKNEVEWRHYACAGVQVFEMSSLFVLFMAFYNRSYKKKPRTKKDGLNSEEELQDDQCQVAVAQATASVSKAASAAYSAASKDASKIMQSARKAAPATVKTNVNGMSRPSWSLIN